MATLVASASYTSTLRKPPPPPPDLPPTAFAVRLNTHYGSPAWCAVCSLLRSAVKQWLREYLAGSSNISRESIRIRQYRYEGLRSWYVPEIILCLPILLQAALALFFVGLLDLLWTLHPIVATVVTAVVAVSMLFAATTSLLPPLYADYPYKSPQYVREKFLTETGRRAAALDDTTLAGADEMFMDDTFLHVVVRPCMRDIAPRAALRCVDRNLLRRAPRVLNSLPYWELARNLHTHHGETVTLTLMHLLLDVLHRLNARRQCELELDGEEDRGGGSGLALFRRMFDVLAGVLAAEVGHAEPERFVREPSFNLMFKLFQRFQDVSHSCIMAFCAYSKQTRRERAVSVRFMVIRASAALAHDPSRAPSMAVHSGHGHNAPEPAEPTAPEPLSMDDDRPYAEGLAVDEPDDYGSVRPAVLKVLDDLEGFLSAPVAKAVELRPTTAMLAGGARPRESGQAGDIAGAGCCAERRGRSRIVGVGARGGGSWVRARRLQRQAEREDQEVNAARQAMRLLRMYGITLYGRDGWRYYA
ncbi:hypothetical protein C8Q76DRAFT_798725 [Earliella scabrosa]|nr:hypothetical protein C8Q76DRAFT_798725 [Earliella scabrosa]